MWVDRDCYLVVGTQTENESGSVVRSSRYVSLQVNPDDIDPAIFEVRGKSKPAQKAASCPGFKVMKPSYVPAGYKLVGTASLSVNGFTCVHLQFSNGVNTISIFEHRESLRGRQAPPEPERVESKTTNVLTWTRDGVQFTIMGDFPRPELHKIANSTR